MFEKISLYLKNQSGYFAVLLLQLVLPLILFFQYSPYPLPYIQYVVLGSLFFFHYVLYKEKKYRHKIEQKIIDQLNKELKQTPSKIEINKRIHFAVDCRGVTIIVIASIILLVMFYYDQL